MGCSERTDLMQILVSPIFSNIVFRHRFRYWTIVWIERIYHIVYLSLAEKSTATGHFCSKTAPIVFIVLSLLTECIMHMWRARKQWCYTSINTTFLVFFSFKPHLTCAIFEFAAEFCALNLSDIEIGLFSAVLLTKPSKFLALLPLIMGPIVEVSHCAWFNILTPIWPSINRLNAGD